MYPRLRSSRPLIQLRSDRSINLLPHLYFLVHLRKRLYRQPPAGTAESREALSDCSRIAAPMHPKERRQVNDHQIDGAHKKHLLARVLIKYILLYAFQKAKSPPSVGNLTACLSVNSVLSASQAGLDRLCRVSSLPAPTAAIPSSLKEESMLKIVLC